MQDQYHSPPLPEFLQLLDHASTPLLHKTNQPLKSLKHLICNYNNFNILNLSCGNIYHLPSKNKRVKVQGFIIFDNYGHRYDEFAKNMSQWLAKGDIKYREHLMDGLESAPEAFIGMLNGENFGKLVIHVNDKL